MPAPPANLRIVAIGLISLALAMGIGRFAFTPLLQMMRADGLVGITGGGWLAAVHFLGYWLGAVLAARASVAPKRLLWLSLLTVAFATLGMGLTSQFAAWLVLRFLAGLCSAWTLVLVSNYYVSYLAGPGRAGAQGWIFSGVGVGIAAAGLACLAFMVGQIGSTTAWQILGLAALVLACGLGVSMGPEIPATRPPAPARAAERSPLDWRIVIAYGAMGCGYIIPATYLPVMAQEIVPEPRIFGWSWPVFGLAAGLSTILAARFSGRFSNRQIWLASQLVMAAGLLLPVAHPHILSMVGAGLCVGGTFMIITMTGMQEAHRIAAPGDVMRHIAVLTAAFATGQMLGPLFASAVYATTQSFAAALALASLALVLTALPLAGRRRLPATTP